MNETLRGAESGRARRHVMPTDSREDALKGLAGASGPTALAEAHAEVRRVVRQRRAKDGRVWGNLAATYAEAMRIRDGMRADGATQAELNAALEQTLRAAWPQTRVWRYLCHQCSDTGWWSRQCEEGSHCGRPFRLPRQAGDEYTGQGRCAPGHDYVQACVCAKGDERRRNLRQERAPEDVMAKAAHVGKLTRFGR